MAEEWRCHVLQRALESKPYSRTLVAERFQKTVWILYWLDDVFSQVLGVRKVHCFLNVSVCFGNRFYDSLKTRSLTTL